MNVWMLHCDAPMSHTQQLQEMLRIHHNPDQDKTLTESEEEEVLPGWSVRPVRIGGGFFFATCDVLLIASHYSFFF